MRSRTATNSKVIENTHTGGLRRELECGELGRRVSEKARGNELTIAHRKRYQQTKSQQVVSYIAVNVKAVVDDKERYMTKLAGAVPNKLEDTRFIFMGNNSPKRMG